MAASHVEAISVGSSPANAGATVQQLVLDEPSDALQVFTRIKLEGVNVAGDDVFFARAKTRWPAAAQAVHRVPP